MTVTSPTTLADSPPLSTLMREGSRAEHEAAETSTFMSELLAGRISPDGYAHFLGLLRRVYATMEAVGSELRDDPLAQAVVDPALERLAAIDEDRAHWGVVDADSPATDAYVQRLEDSRGWSGLFIAHHYTRYLGDLSGGQAIGRILAREYDLDGGGTAFYRFEQVPKPKPYKAAYRARLDLLDLAPADRHRIVTEVKAAFDLNGAVFAEMTEQLPRFRR